MRTDTSPHVLAAVTLATALAVAPLASAGSLGSAADATLETLAGLAAEVGLVDEPDDPEGEPGEEDAFVGPRRTDPPDRRPDPLYPLVTPAYAPWNASEAPDDASAPSEDASDGDENGSSPSEDGSDAGENDSSLSEDASDGSETAGDASSSEDGSDGSEPAGDASSSEDGSDGSEPAGDAPVPPLGMHANGLQRMEDASDSQADPSDFAYGQIWVGAWNLRYGWSNVEEQLDWMARHDVTPVIQVFYWGNDIAPRCLEDGCAGKSPAGWDRLVDELTSHLWSRLEGREAVVVLEPEFNKGNVATHEPLDAAMAEKSRQVHEEYPDATVALGFGGWGTENWDTWDRAMEAADVMGLQVMRGSTQNSPSSYGDAAETVTSQAETLNEMSGKPVLINDVALATYGGETYRDLQAQELSDLLGRRQDLQEAEVQGIVYRALHDDPDATTEEYYGEAETTWGLRYANGTPKPGLDAWMEGVEARAGG